MKKAPFRWTEAVCPFLYQTRTIQASLTRTTRPTSASQKVRCLSTASEEHSRPLVWPSRLPDQRPQDLPSRPSSTASTITKKERKAFEKIRQKFGGTVTGITPVHDDALNEATQGSDLPLYDLDINGILSLFAPLPEQVHESVDLHTPFDKFKSPQKPENQVYEDHEEAEETTYKPSSPVEVRTAALAALQHISASIRAALRSSSVVPDKALWQVFEVEILPLVLILPQYRSPLSDEPNVSFLRNPYQATLGGLSSDTEKPSVIPTSLIDLPPSTPLLPLITILYPAATLLVLRTYAAYLPTSRYTLELLPKIKSLGPTSYILAGSTPFYNCLLQLQWEIYSDLDTIDLMLKEMGKNGIDYDRASLAVLDRIAWERKVDLGQLDGANEIGSIIGSGRSKEWWSMGAVRDDGIGKVIKGWAPRMRAELRRREEERRKEIVQEEPKQNLDWIDTVN